MSVSSDSAFPLFQQAFSGDTADVDTYIKQWQNLIDLLGRQDFLFVGQFCSSPYITNYTREIVMKE